MRPVRIAALIAAAVVIAACSAETGVTTTAADGTSSTTVPPATSPTTTTTNAVPDTTMPPVPAVPLSELVLGTVEVDTAFDNPVLFVASPDGGTDLVVEQPGRIVRADGGDHAVVLDIRDDVAFEGEQGLLGFAVHPDFEQNSLVYVNYTNNLGDTVIEQFSMDGGIIIPETRLVVLVIDQPADNHNGGMIAFGPDGYLWIGMGDGGGSNDRFGNGQNPDSLLGSMVRIGVGRDGDDPYSIPSDNPFSDGTEGRPEIWAIGLRNPWRFAFDGQDLWIADVGQGAIEEVDLVSTVTAGLNFGWNTMEGSECFSESSCDASGLVLPITQYTHAEGCSITGGAVYRGASIPSLQGQFFFADYCTGLLRSIAADGSGMDWTGQVGNVGNITGFGVGADGELYIVTQQGSLLRIAEVNGG